MIDDLLTEENVWDRLRREGKPLVLYGMGDGAEKINAVLESKGMHISAVFASDDFVRGQSFLGHTVQRYREVCAQLTDFNVVLGFASQRPEVLENIARINQEHPVYAPDIPVAGVGLFTREYAAAHRAEIETVYAKLADEESRRVYHSVLRYKISGKVDYLYNSFANMDEIFTEILQVNQQEILVDMGAYNGDTIRQFLQYSCGKYKSIYALEPDGKTSKSCAAPPRVCKAFTFTIKVPGTGRPLCILMPAPGAIPTCRPPVRRWKPRIWTACCKARR